MKRKIQFLIGWRRLAVVTALCLAGGSAAASTTLFSDTFKGPQMNRLWVPSLPNVPVAKGDYAPETYEGAPNYVFTAVHGVHVLRMNTVLAPLQRVGWVLNTKFHSADFRYEVRFNTLVQSPSTSIDGFIEIWVLDVTDPTRYDMVSLFGADWSGSPAFDAGSSISQLTFDNSFAYQNNTFYRLVLRGSTNEDIRAAVCDDQGNELMAYDLGHNLSDYPSGFTVAISQAMDRPETSYPTDVAIASATVTTGGTTISSTTTPAVIIAFSSTVGRSYQLQKMVVGRQSQWLNVGVPVVGTGDKMDFAEPSNAGNQVLYRIQMLP